MNTSKEILRLFDKGAELKNRAQSVNGIASYLEAASFFNRSATLSLLEAEREEARSDDKQQHLVFGHYYAYEEAHCLGVYYYESHDAQKSIGYLKRAKEELDIAIQMIEDVPASVTAKVQQRLVGFLPRWRFFLRELDLSVLANEARKSWDNGHFIEALDIYRTMAERERAYIDETKVDTIEPKYRRIATGNYIGMMANASSAIAAEILERTKVADVDGVSEVPFDLLVKLVKHTLDAYRFGNQAFDQNPESNQYGPIASLCRRNIQKLLEDNPAVRLPLSIAFRNDPDFITILELTEAFSKAGEMVAPERTRILFLSANPTDTQPLRLDEELRAIKQKVRSAEYRDRFELFVGGAARPDDFLQLVNEYRPHIVHFSGHGSDTENLVVCDDNGGSKLINKDALVTLFESTLSDVVVVVLNACHSRSQAEAIASVVPCAIGMDDSISDPAAAVFAGSFYRALAFGFSVRQAFVQGLAALKLEDLREADVPQLITRPEIDPDKLFVIESPRN